MTVIPLRILETRTLASPRESSNGLNRQIVSTRRCGGGMKAESILKRASASRPSGEWNDDDYDVLAEGAVVGRILKVHAPR